MRVRTLEIRWHDQKPILTCDFQPTTHARRTRLPTREHLGNLGYRLATGGEDNNVRIWFVRPNILPITANSSSSVPPPLPHPPRVEYRSTLSKHQAAVNVVRFSPNGELIASAGDDGMIIIWAQTDRPPTAVYGSENTDEDPEYWKVRISFRCTTNEIYDLAWSPTGDYVIAGSTDNAARIFSVADGTCVRELAEHNHFVQGVAWDPMNEFIATQSSDRAVHVYSVSTKHGIFETHAVGKNSRMYVRHSRTPSVSTGRPRMVRRSSTASDNESAVSVREDPQAGPLTPATSIASTPSMFPPPQIERSSSRRSSFSGSNAAGSPAPSSHGHFGRSPSPMPPLPAIRPQPINNAVWSSIKLYGDESFTNFFRRLTFSPDGAMLLTPAGHFEDPSILPGSSRVSSKQPGRDEQNTRGRKAYGSTETDPTSASSVYIYTRANFARPPVAQLPGHKKASVAVKFSPVLYELRPDLLVETEMRPPKRVNVERGQDQTVELDIGVPVPPPVAGSESSVEPEGSLKKTSAPISTPTVSAVSPATMSAPPLPLVSPAMSTESLPPVTRSSPTPVHAPPPSTSSTSVFALPYRMLFAIATMDTITIHDTQQAGPVCMFSKLHYDEFTDMAWSPDGQCLLLTSRDGFCTIIVLDEHLPAYHTQQSTLQLQSLAHAIGPHQHLHAPAPIVPASVPAAAASLSHMAAGSSRKRSEPPAPAVRVGPPSEEFLASGPGSSLLGTGDLHGAGQSRDQGPPKKKRRVALTRVGDLNT